MNLSILLKYCLLFFLIVYSSNLFGDIDIDATPSGWVPCPPTVYGSCTSSDYLGNTIQMDYHSLSPTDIEFRVRKCDLTSFSNSGTIYIKDGSSVCGTIINSVSFNSGVSTIFITVPLNYNGWVAGSKDFTITLTSSSGDRFNAGTVNIFKECEDYQVTNVTIANSIVFQGQQNVDLSCLITNIGNETSSDDVTFFISVDSNYDPGVDLDMGDRNFDLTGGSSTTLTRSIDIPINLPAGSYYIVAYADENFGDTECQEWNNGSFVFFQVTNAPDLEVTDVSFSPIEICNNDNTILDVDFLNSGTGTVGNFDYEIYFSSNTSLGSSDLLFGTFTFGGLLLPGSSGTRTHTVSIPSSWTDNDFYIIVRVDPNNTINEQNELNNIGISSIELETFESPFLVYPPDDDTITSLTPTLDWNTVSGANQYAVVVKKHPSNITVVAENTGLNSFYTIPSSILEYNTEYKWVAAVDLGGGQLCNSNYYHFFTPCDDTYEPNDNFSAPNMNAFSTTLGSTSYSHSINSFINNTNDVDHFEFSTSQSGEITIDLTSLPEDYDLELWPANGSSAIASSAHTSTVDEQIIYDHQGGIADFVIKIYSYYDQYDCDDSYSLMLSWSPTSGNGGALQLDDNITTNPSPVIYDDAAIFNSTILNNSTQPWSGLIHLQLLDNNNPPNVLNVIYSGTVYIPANGSFIVNHTSPNVSTVIGNYQLRIVYSDDNGSSWNSVGNGGYTHPQPFEIVPTSIQLHSGINISPANLEHGGVADFDVDVQNFSFSTFYDSISLQILDSNMNYLTWLKKDKYSLSSGAIRNLHFHTDSIQSPAGVYYLEVVAYDGNAWHPVHENNFVNPKQISIAAPANGITITSPTSSTSFNGGDVLDVLWTVQGSIGNVSLELQDAAGGLISVLANGIPSSSSPFTSFTIPSCQATGNYRIKIYETGTGSFEEYSPLFNISKQPNCSCSIISPSLPNNDPIELINAADSLCTLNVIIDPPNGDTEPYRFTTRAELAKMAFVSLFENYNAQPSDNFPSPFLDLQNTNDWFYRAGKALSYLEYDNGITPFDRNLEYMFRPQDSIPRTYAVKVLLETFNITPDGSLGEPYSDVTPSTDGYAYIAKAYDLGIITNPNDSFRPYENTLRGEAFLMIYRFLQKFSDGSLTKPVPVLDDFFCPSNQKPENFARNIGISEGNFNHYSVTSFSLHTISMSLNFSHEYNTYLTDLPDDYFPILPLGKGWSHTYNSYIQDVPVWDDDSGSVEQKLIQFNPSGQMIVWDNPESSFPYSCISETNGVYDSLTYISNNIIEIKSKSQSIFTYEKMSVGDDKEALLLIQIEDRINRKIEITYETGNGIGSPQRIETVKLVLGNSKQNHRILNFDYKSGTNFISRVWLDIASQNDPDIHFDVNGDEDLISYTDRMNAVSEYRYIQDIDPTATEDEINQKKHLLYEVKMPKGNIIENTYEKRKLKSTHVNDKLKTEIDITYNYGLPSVGIESDIEITNTELNFNTHEEHIEFDPDDLGRRQCVTVQSNVTCFDYTDSRHPFLPTKITDQETNLEVDFAYDDEANLTRREIYLQGEDFNPNPDYEYDFNYNDYNDLSSITDISGNSIIYDFGVTPSQGLIQNVTDQEGNITNYEYYNTTLNLWKSGGLKKITSPMNISVEFDYDLYGNLKDVNAPNNINTNTVFDELARVITNTTANGYSYQYEYFDNDQIKKASNPDGNDIVHSYDDNYNLKTITNERGYTTTLDYNYDTDLLEKVSFGGNDLEYDYYTSDGRVKSITKPDGTVISPTYIPSDNGIGKIENDGFAMYSYDTEHRIESITKINGGENHKITYHYDNLNRITSYDYNVTGSVSYSFVVAYEYDLIGNLYKVKYPNLNGSGTLDVEYTYYDNYWLKEITDWENKTTNFFYHSDGGIDYIERPNGTICKYVYESSTRRISGKVDSITNGAVINKYIYILDDQGNIVSETRTEHFAEVSYQSIIQTATYQSNNFTNQVNGVSQNINANGNLESDGVNVYSWDNAFDVLQSININTSYKYDGLGNRRERLDNGVKVRYIHDMLGMSNVIAEMDESGNGINYYVYAGNQLLYRKKVNGSSFDDHYYHFNFQGSTVAMTDETATISHSYGYSPYGEVIDKEEADENTFTFNGEYGVITESDNLYYMRARYYDSSTGRFLSQDPIWSTNLFAFGNGNPLMSGDPMGMEAEVWAGSVIGIDNEFLYTPPTITVDNSIQAVGHYLFGNGENVDLGEESINAILNSDFFTNGHEKIINGDAQTLTGIIAGDLEGDIFHIGNTSIYYEIGCFNYNKCSVQYDLFYKDGFWDPDFIDEYFLGKKLNIKKFTPDGTGKNLERFGGTPYHYNTVRKEYLFSPR